MQRVPFTVGLATVTVPWNKIVTMEPIILYLDDEQLPVIPACSVVHDHISLRPHIFSMWQHSQLGACPAVSTVIPESQV